VKLTLFLRIAVDYALGLGDRVNTLLMAKTAIDPRSLARHILVVEDEPLLRDLLAKSIEAAGFDVSTAANAADAKRLLKNTDPDAIVLDIELGPGPNGFDLAEVVSRQYPSVGVVFLTNLPDPRFTGNPKSIAKNQAYLRKGVIHSGNELIEVIEAVLRDRVTKQYRHDLAYNRPLAALSQRQLATLQLVSEGKTNAQIASLRGTTVRAVESMLSRIFESMGIDPSSSNPRVEAVSRLHSSRVAAK
jgi:DNA-binding NarL/FixJ family response regulator